MPDTIPGETAPGSATAFCETRALWISRFDWGNPPLQRDRLLYLINRAADAGFNTVLFQVRATGDAYYAPRLEPWSYRLTSASPATLGADPGWDPLAVAIEAAHSRGIELHAYLNIYPLWECGRSAPPHTTPEHPYWTLGFYRPEPYHYDMEWRAHAATDSGPLPMGDTSDGPVPCQQYIWSSPGVLRVHEHHLAVVRDIVRRYPVDGVHFDRVRYPGRQFSADPETLRRWAAADPPLAQADWQRNVISSWVAAARDQVKALRPAATVSAAVWFTYKKTAAMNFPTSQGYYDYYQDSHRWLREGFVDALVPMIYGDPFNEDIYKWQVLAEDHMTVQGHRQVWLGIGAAIFPFERVVDRIAYARDLGARGVAVWSAGAMENYDYWDAFALGPFWEPAQPYPTLPDPAGQSTQ